MCVSAAMAIDGVTSGIQLWINLPKRLKHIEPEYQQVDAAEIPETNENGIRIRHIVGPQGKVQLQTPVVYQDVHISAGSRFAFDVPDNFSGLVYIVNGELDYAGQKLDSGKTVLFSEIEEVTLVADNDSHLMFCMGIPHGETILQHGPFVD